MHSEVLNTFLKSQYVAIFLTTISYLVGYAAGWIAGAPPALETFAVYTSFSCTYLCVKESRWNYPVGAISVVAYSVLFWQSNLVSSAALNAYLAPVLIYGWFRWGPDRDTRRVRHVGIDRWLIAYAVWTAVAFIGSAWLAKKLGGTMAPADAFILIGSIVAQLLLDNKRIETWFVWAIVNVVAIVTYWNAGLYLVAFQFVFFLGNSLYGYACWAASMDEWRRAESAKRWATVPYPAGVDREGS